jgi:hypothetical protein
MGVGFGVKVGVGTCVGMIVGDGASVGIGVDDRGVIFPAAEPHEASAVMITLIQNTTTILFLRVA